MYYRLQSVPIFIFPAKLYHAFICRITCEGIKFLLYADFKVANQCLKLIKFYDLKIFKRNDNVLARDV